MGRVTAIAVDGLDLWYNSSDHLPPHFHARRAGEWEVRIDILRTTMEELVYDPKWPPRVTLPGAISRTLRVAVVTNRAALLTEWEAKVCVREDL
jgi:hypothetical protein